MNAAEFTDAVRTETKTERSRLGSSKSLYADTEGDMDEEPVLAAIADHLHFAAETFETWADAESGAAADLFAAVAATASESYETVAGEHGDHDPGETPALVESLGGLETTTERLGGTVGWAMVVETKLGQAVGFFVGQASPQTASTFRELRSDVEAVVDDASEALLADHDETDDAQTAAVGAIEAAYDAYVETLEAMGVNPKPVC